MLKIFPDEGYLRRMLPVLQNNHLSIYYKPRSGWLGEPAARFSKTLNAVIPGSITKVFPVPSGMEVSGWAYDGGSNQGYRWIVLANERGRIVGFGERFPAGIPDDPVVGNSGDPRLPTWIGFANPGIKSNAYRAYVVLPGGLSPLSGSFQVLVPPFTAASADSLGASVSGIRWKADSSKNTIPHISLNYSPRGPVYSTWNGSDGNTEHITSSAFDVPSDGCIVLPVLHGPSVDGLAVNVWDAEGKHIIGTVPMRDSDQQWRFWRMLLEARITRLRITVDDEGRGWGQWVAIGQPSRCR
jgi:hypothetical protein